MSGAAKKLDKIIGYAKLESITQNGGGLYV